MSEIKVHKTEFDDLLTSTQKRFLGFVAAHAGEDFDEGENGSEAMRFYTVLDDSLIATLTFEHRVVNGYTVEARVDYYPQDWGTPIYGLGLYPELHNSAYRDGHPLKEQYDELVGGNSGEGTYDAFVEGHLDRLERLEQSGRITLNQG